MEIDKIEEQTTTFIKYEVECDCGNSIITDNLKSDLQIGVSSYCRVCGNKFVIGIKNNEMYIKPEGDDKDGN